MHSASGCIADLRLRRHQGCPLGERALSRVGWEAPSVRGRVSRRRLLSVLWPWSGRQKSELVNRRVALS
jgi:hypothetical protein